MASIGLAFNIVGLFLFSGHAHSHSHSHGHKRNSLKEDKHEHNENAKKHKEGHSHKGKKHLEEKEGDESKRVPKIEGKEEQTSSTMYSVFLHVLGDALGSVAVIASALFIWLTPFSWRFYFDPIIRFVCFHLKIV